MSLDATARRRYARQLLLAELSEAGQQRLLAARFCEGADADAGAFAVAAEYLERAGCSRDDAGAEARVPGSGDVMRFAGSPALREPAALVMGAFAAVEHIKEVLGVGVARELPPDLVLSAEP
ncbi:MAG: hypothetical protein WCF10_12945 [Polyangiales bacterium]